MHSSFASCLSCQIKDAARQLGFSACGIAPAAHVSQEEASYFEEWLAQGHQAGMVYMENYREMRLDPRLLVKGTRSVVSVALNYYPEKFLDQQQYQLAWYAYGKDYHEVMREKLSALWNHIHTRITPVKGRFFCDTAPVLERYWAWRAGIGWIGKNTQLIVPGAGSCFFLGELFLDVEVDLYDLPLKNRCGSCKRCLEWCPAGALEAPYVLNACKCLSYLTIENRSEIPALQAAVMGNRMYGCDECQKACPWNRFAIPTSIEAFRASPDLLAMRISDWEKLTVERYRSLFKGSAVKRAKYEGVLRNIRTLSAKDISMEPGSEE